MKDFWLSCGHHLLDRDEGGGLVVTDEFLKAYLARPELSPPPDACAAELPCRATQDGQVMMESSDKMWSTEEGNGKPLQYSCLENPMNSISCVNVICLFYSGGS